MERFMNTALSTLVIAIVCALAAPAQALDTMPDTMSTEKAEQAAVGVDTDAKTIDEYDELAKMAVNHPNELYRIYGAKAAANGQWADAVHSFRKAARYADKYSQHRLSLLYWHGVGVGRDRVEAYVWADIAAERGYPQFLAIREKMWGELSPQEQARVPARGDALYKEYGDPVAKRRFADAIAHGKRQVTGSRTGFVGNLAIASRGSGTSLFGDGGGTNLQSMYDASRTDPKKYWEFEDHVWKTVTVNVGDLEQTSSQPVPKQNDQAPAKTP
jgi:uncharacterized protein